MAKATSVQIDHLDWQILHLLQHDARLSFAEIGRKIHLSLSAVAERIRKLEEHEILTGYHAIVNPVQVGLPIQAFIRLKTSNRENCLRVVDIAQSLPEVREVYRVTGSESYLLKVAVSSMAHLEQLIDELATLGDIETSMILSMPVWKPAIEQEIEQEERLEA